jgi:hypothetical protein
MVVMDLTPTEHTLVAEIQARFSTRAQHPISLDKLLARWSRFVGQVEQGYQWSIDEYTNDLTTRNLIEEVLVAAPDDLRQKVEVIVRPIDERFAQATSLDTKQRITEFIKPYDGWWWSRLPIKLVGTLAADLKASA